MSMLSEQIKAIRDCVKKWQTFENIPSSEPFKLLSEAADTIEALSAKLAAANMEQSDRYYGGGWITERVPTKEECGNYRGHFLVTVYAPELKTLCMEYEYTTIRGKEVGRWIWCDRVNIPWKVIAWKKLPEPYRP